MHIFGQNHAYTVCAYMRNRKTELARTWIRTYFFANPVSTFRGGQNLNGYADHRIVSPGTPAQPAHASLRKAAITGTV